MGQHRECDVEGCASTVLAKGLCAVHYSRKRRTGSVELQPKLSDSMCIECGLRRAAYAPGLCRVCQQRNKRDAQPAAGTCAHCGEAFVTKRRYAQSTGRGIYCSRNCKEAAYRLTGKANLAARRHYYKNQYGLTIEQAEEMRRAGCAICGAKDGGGRWGSLHIDHCHAQGHVRGVLCGGCNNGLGMFRDDPELLLKAAAYLKG